MNRVRAWGLLVLGFVANPAAASGEPLVADFAALRERARALASAPPRTSSGEVPAWLRNLSYDQLRRIEFDTRQSLWAGGDSAFEAQFLHPGFLFDRSVRIWETHPGGVRPIPFRTGLFRYRGVEPGLIPAELGFAGFRLMHPFGGRGEPFQEIGSFAGASYFRFLPAGAAYGLSARGLALDTAADRPEEFPRFSEFWLERPAADDRAVTVLALLESERVTGAYRFHITPGAETVVAVSAELHFRGAPGVVGLAPLTSMFWRGEGNGASPDDYRPEVHDSDGLLLHRGSGEWLWRPLANPARLTVATFADENPRGFGLLQRDRDFEHYQDLEAAYHLRPGLWVEPVGRWGRGGVRLVEIPTRTEFDDNVVACWVPEAAPVPGTPFALEYRLRWFLDGIGPPGARAIATRRGKSGVHEPGFERFVVDFAGGPLADLAAEAPVEAVVTVDAAAAPHHVTVQRNRFNGSWRVAFLVRPPSEPRPVELRCFLRLGGEALSETWSHLWQP
jgi:glucans biosynthesis protein